MEVILREDIQGLGYKNDVVTVKPGYGRNFLIPRGHAIIASKSNVKMINENVRQASHKAEKLKKDAEALAEKIGDLTLTINTKAGESGKIFGAITTLQVADTLEAKGITIDRKKITFPSQIKELGEHTAVLDLHKEIKKEVQLKIVAE
ncbi:MAG: 50S ribosomal protein L9 [Bacteroidota bacterium]